MQGGFVAQLRIEGSQHEEGAGVRLHVAHVEVGILIRAADVVDVLLPHLIDGLVLAPPVDHPSVQRVGLPVDYGAVVPSTVWVRALESVLELERQRFHLELGEVFARVVDRLLRSRGYLRLSSLNQFPVSELGSGSDQRHQVSAG